MACRHDEPVQAWLFDCDNRFSEDDFSILDRGEREHCARLSRAEDKAAFVKAHAARRLLLSDLLKVPIQEISFLRSASGKPIVLPGLSDEDIGVSISHTRGYAAVVISRSGAVGIDIERRRVVTDALKITDELFGAQVACRLAQYGRTQQHEIFLKLWTAAEAWAKATGLGLANLPSNFAIDLTRSGDPSLTRHSVWQLYQLSLPIDCIGSVVVGNNNPTRKLCQSL
jgi:4'-phosphopantetheinyl transferase